MTTPADNTLTTKTVAERLGTDPKTLRSFLRASTDYEGVGSGSRYSFTNKDVSTLKTRFAKWEKERAASKVERDAAKAKALAEVAEKTAESITAAS